MYSFPKAAPSPPTRSECTGEVLKAIRPEEASANLHQTIAEPSLSTETLREKEQVTSALSDWLSQKGGTEDLRMLLTELRPFFLVIPKAKTAKIVRGVIDATLKLSNASELQISVCREIAEWTRAEKRTFLTHRVEARLALLLIENKDYSEALSLLTNLVSEVGKLHDKLFLVDIHILESQLHFSSSNLPKAKAALTAARTATNAIYVPPAQQGTIDLQNGILHAEEKDFETAFSCFFQAFEAVNASDHLCAVFSLKYMLLCKIMIDSGDDVEELISSKAGSKYAGVEIDAMKAVAEAYGKRSLNDFQEALQAYKEQLQEDPIAHRHLSALYDTLLEREICVG